jgi:hypothetical protein
MTDPIQEMNNRILQRSTDELVEMFVANVRIPSDVVTRWDNIVLSLIKDELGTRGLTRSDAITRYYDSKGDDN